MAETGLTFSMTKWPVNVSIINAFGMLYSRKLDSCSPLAGSMLSTVIEDQSNAWSSLEKARLWTTKSMITT